MIEFISIKQNSFPRSFLPSRREAHTGNPEWRGFCLWARRRHDLGERGGSSLGESWHRRAGRQEDTSLLISYQVSFPPLRKALAFLIFDDSHLPSIFSFSYSISPSWKKKIIQGLFCKGTSEESRYMEDDLPLPFGV